MKKVDNISFNEKEVLNLSYKEFSDSFSHLLTKTPVDVAYKLVTGKTPPKKKGYVRKNDKPTGESKAD